MNKQIPSAVMRYRLPADSTVPKHRCEAWACFSGMLSMNGIEIAVYKTSSLLSIVLFAISFTGCAHVGSSTRLQPPKPKSLKFQKQLDSTVLKDGFVQRFHNYAAGQCIKDFGDATDGGTCSHDAPAIQAARNIIIEAIRAEIDDKYGDYVSSLFVSRAGFNVLSDAVNIGLTSAATITGDKEISDMLTAAATGLVGTKASVDKNFFDDQARQAIVATMDSSRTEIGNEIEQGEAADGAAYSLEKALGDLRRYYEAGTLAAGLQAISTNAGVQKKAADTQRSTLRIQQQSRPSK